MRRNQLLVIFAESVKHGGGILTSQELAYMMGVTANASFTKFLADCSKANIIRRVARGVFESKLTPADPYLAPYLIVKKLRGHVLSYVSLESQLSHTGDISQIIMGTITMMTKGRSGIFETPYGKIEFTHTKQPGSQIMPNLYFDSDIKMYRANTAQAIKDLKSCRRNLHMIED